MGGMGLEPTLLFRAPIKSRMLNQLSYSPEKLGPALPVELLRSLGIYSSPPRQDSNPQPRPLVPPAGFEHALLTF